MIPVEAIRWIVVAAGAVVSTTFLMLNVKSMVSSLPQVRGYMIIGGVVAMNMLLSIVLKVYFFANYV